jgi:fatty-acyl-CoA synthase
MGHESWGVLRDVLIDRASAFPDRLAFAHHGRELTFAQLAERAAGRAAALRAQGVRPGDRVAVAMSTGLELAEVFWGIQLLGAASCVFNPNVPADTLARRISLVDPRLVLTDESAAALAPTTHRLAPAEVGPDDLAFLQLTSGTSGEPRASMILHRNIVSYLRTCRSAKTLTPDNVFVCWVPPWHDLGLVRFIIGAVHCATSCYIVDPSVRTIPEWLREISRERATYSATPDFALRLASRMVDPDEIDLSSLRYMKSGGEPVRWSTIQLFEDRFQVPGVVIPGYGLGEATLGVSEHLPGEEIPVDERGNVSCGPPNASLELRAGSSLDSPDEILVRGDSVFAGYFAAPAETAHVLRDGWLHTGDSGYLDDAGRLFVLGRREGMIKRAGAVIAPRELEEAAQRVEGVRVAAATSVRAATHGDEIIVVAVEPERDDASAEKIASSVSRQIVAALGFSPGRITVLPRRTIPRTENGKIRHGQLRALLEANSA